jgi:hypothetical protein
MSKTEERIKIGYKIINGYSKVLLRSIFGQSDLIYMQDYVVANKVWKSLTKKEQKMILSWNRIAYNRNYSDVDISTLYGFAKEDDYEAFKDCLLDPSVNQSFLASLIFFISKLKSHNPYVVKSNVDILGIGILNYLVRSNDLTFYNCLNRKKSEEIYLRLRRLKLRALFLSNLPNKTKKYILKKHCSTIKRQEHHHHLRYENYTMSEWRKMRGYNFSIPSRESLEDKLRGFVKNITKGNSEKKLNTLLKDMKTSTYKNLYSNYISYCLLFVPKKRLPVYMGIAEEMEDDFTKKKINKLIQIKLEE